MLAGTDAIADSADDRTGASVDPDSLQIAVEHVVALDFVVPGADRQLYPAWIRRFVSRRPITGFIVGAGDGRRWGWWGPVPARVASDAKELFSAVDARRPASPDEWGRRLRRSARHAHTGLLGCAVGAVELACWDLVGQRNDRPIWALTASSERTDVPTYATCLGLQADDGPGAAVARAVSQRWPVQKWRPSAGGEEGILRRLMRLAGGAGRLALDFGGAWRPPAVRRLCEAVGGRLAWVEEPYAPDELHLASPGEFPAPHAAGEHCYGPHETAVLARAGVDIWQPDAVFCGGHSNLRAIAGQAATAGARCIPHGGGFLSSLHAAFQGSPIEMVEYHLLMEPRRQAHLAHPILPLMGGAVARPCDPGWAGPLRDGILERHGAP